MTTIISILLVIYFIFCYAVGGQGPKWIRRFLGPIIFGLGVMTVSALRGHLSIVTVLASAWYCPSLIIFRYGVNDNDTRKKVFLRMVYGASLGAAGFLIGVSGGHIGLGVLQFITATAGSAFFGLVNPFSRLGDKGVVLEDLCIAACAVCFVTFIA